MKKENFNHKISETTFYKFLTKKHSPISVFIDKDFSILFINGDFKKFINKNKGIYTNNLLMLLDTELASIIKNGLCKVIEKDTSISIKNILFKLEDKNTYIDIYIDIAKDIDFLDKVFLIEFSNSIYFKVEEEIILKENDLSEYTKQRLKDLEYELKEKKYELQSLIEKLEASNEELISSNKKLQSVNEKLYIVNSEFQKKNKELEILNNDLNNLLNSIEMGTLFLDLDLNIRKFTPEIKRLFTLEDTDIGRSIELFTSIFSDSVRQLIIDESKNAIENLISTENEIQDNSGNWYIKQIKPFITIDKKIDGVIISLININSMKKTTFDLIQTQEQLSLALDAGNIAWWEVQLPSGNVHFSPNKVLMLGLNPSDFNHYSHFMNIVHPDDYENTINAFRQMLSGEKSLYDCEYRIRNNKEEYQWFRDVGKILRKENDIIIITGIVIDITKDKIAEINLKEALKKADSANIYKNQFLSNMSHEIRTPLNAILGFSYLLKEDNLPVEIKSNYIDIIESSSNQLMTLINDIIEFSKIEAGELKIEMSEFNLHKLFLEIEETFQQIKRQKNKEYIQIIYDIKPENKDIFVKTDRYRLQQVIFNLLGNSIKFIEKGSINFGFTIENNKINIFVKDTGIGIPTDKLDIIFERFKRVNSQNNAKYDGTGLGLSISKGIIDLLGGKIYVESKENEGTSFTFFVPFIEVKNKLFDKILISKDNEYFENLKEFSILIAEDELINTRLLKELLKKFPINLFFAYNGLEAVSIYKENKIDIVLMDIRMPIMDGYEAASEIFKINPNAKIIAQTAYAMTDEHEKLLKFGFCDYISKPIQRNNLISILLKWKNILTENNNII